MLKKIFSFLLYLVIVFPAISQTAKFIADTSDLRKKTGGNQENFDRAMEMQWLINGKKLTWGKTINAKPCGAEMDTVLYKQTKNSRWDTLYCFIHPGKTYTFIYNDCCNAFDVRDTFARHLHNRILSLTIIGESSMLYFGKIGENALVESGGSTDSLSNICNSALIPRIYPVQLYSITECKDSTGCIEAEECVFKNGKKELDYTPFYYTINSTITSFVYLPLQNETLNIIYDPKTKKLKCNATPL